METNLKVMGISRKSENGQVIDNRGFDLEYDGNYADINSFVNNKNKHLRLNNKELLELLNRQVSSQPLESRLINDFNISPKILSLMDTNRALTIRKLSSGKKSKLSRKTSKSKSKKLSSNIYKYPILNKFKIPKLEMEKLIPYGLMTTNLKSKKDTQKLKSIFRKSTSKTKSNKSKFKKLKSKSYAKSKSQLKRVSFIPNNSNSLRDILSPINTPSKVSSQLIRRATPYVRRTSSKLSNIIPKTSNTLNKTLPQYTASQFSNPTYRLETPQFEPRYQEQFEPEFEPSYQEQVNRLSNRY